MCLPEFLAFLDEHGIPHRSIKAIKKKLKRNKKSMLRMKQYFLKKGITVNSSQEVKRAMSTCRGCICIPQDIVQEEWARSLKG